MDRRQLWRYIQRVWITLGLSVTVIFVTWSLVAYRASAAARDATRSDETVAVRHDDGTWSFLPPAQRELTTPAIIFFPGALVDPVAYAPLLRAVAGAGYPAFMIELPRRGAFGGAEDPAIVRNLDRLLATARYPTTVGGRWPLTWRGRRDSGGRIEQRAGFAALILIGTSHPRDVDLNTLTVPVTKIAGTRDGLASPAKVEANRALLPAATRWVWIEGGNHSQFGWYGFQPGDRRATISAECQRAAMIRAVLDVMTDPPTSTPVDGNQPNSKPDQAPSAAARCQSADAGPRAGSCSCVASSGFPRHRHWPDNPVLRHPGRHESCLSATATRTTMTCRKHFNPWRL